MTLNEFRYWLEGYEQVFKDCGHPDKYRWSKIKEQLDKVREPVTFTPYNNTPIPLGNWPYQPTQTWCVSSNTLQGGNCS